MAKYVTRTFITTVIHGVSVRMVGGNCVTNPLADIVVDGKLDDDKADKALKKAYPDDSNVLVKGVEYKTELRAMRVEDFKAYSTIIYATVMPEKGSADVDADETETAENY